MQEETKMQKSRFAEVEVNIKPALTLCVIHKNRKILLEYVEFLKENAAELEGKLVYSKDCVDEFMLIFEFADFDQYHAFAELSGARD